VQYGVENFYATVGLTAVGYSTLTSSGSGLQYGKSGSLAVTSSCQYSQVNGPSSTAYTVISYNGSQIAPSSGSSCSSTSTSTCQHSLSSPYSLLFTPAITTSTSAVLTFTAYTYYSNAYYPLCSSSLTMPLSQQSITMTGDLTGCSNQVRGACVVGISGVVSGVNSGDSVWVTGLVGTVTDATWSSSTISGVTWFSYTLAASDITTATSTVTLSLSYTAPSYTSASNSLSSF
jgi:hypothetical protein